MKSRLLPLQVIVCLIISLVSMQGWVHARDLPGLVDAAPVMVRDQGLVLDEPRSSITVTTFADEYVANGICSLRQAIVAANLNTATMGCTAGSGTDTIILASGVYTLSIPGSSEDNNLTGDLDILESVTIIGVSSTETIIDGADLDRVFDVHVQASAGFESLKVTNGTAPAMGSNGEDGGGIRATGNLTLDDVVISENHAGNGTNDFGDGGNGGGIYCSGTLDITDSTIQGNYAGNGAERYLFNNPPGDGGNGGGIMATGPVTIRDSSILYNNAGQGGYDTFFEDAGDGGHGGGIMTSSSAEITHTEIHDNRAGHIGGGPWGSGGDGGGIYNTGTLNILTSSIATNWAGAGRTETDGHAGEGGGLVNYLGATANIIMSSIYGNHGAVNGMGSDGAGILNDGTLWIVNSTIAGNSGSYRGGGILNNGTATINSSTIADNSSQFGGGIYNVGTKTVTISNTLVAQNIGYQGGYDCQGTLTSGGYNLIRDISPTYCSIDGDLTGVLTGTSHNPLISSYDYHGGLTKNYILLAGSPLLNIGNPLPVGSGGFSCPVVDQREVSRPQNSRCDIGSTEAIAQLTVTKNVDVVFTYPGQLITYSIMVTNIGAVAGTGIYVFDNLPAGLVFEGPITLSVSHPEAIVALDASRLPKLVTGLSLAAGESVVVYFPVRTALDYTENQVIRNTARAYTATPQTEGSGYKDIWTGWRVMLPMVVR